MHRWFWRCALALSAVFCLFCGASALGLPGRKAPETSIAALRPYRGLGSPSILRIDINEVSDWQLLLYPGLSSDVKEGILALRNELGRIRSLDELAHVPGIGISTLKKLYTLFYIRPLGSGTKFHYATGRIEELQ